MSLSGTTLTVSVLLLAKDQLSGVLEGVKQRVDGLASASHALLKIGAGLAGASMATARMSSSAQTMLTGLAKSAASVDDLIAKLRSMPDVTDQMAAGFAASARKWASAHANTVEEYLETVYQMVSAGLTTPEQALAATETALRVAKGTMGDAVATANSIAVAYNNMADKTKPAADEIGRLGDILTKTQQLFQISNMAQLSEGLKYAFPAAKAMRMEITELAAVIGQLNTAGLQGSQAGTAFAASMRELIGAQKELGFTIVRNRDGTLDFTRTLEAITQRFGDFTRLSDKEAAALQKAFGDEGARAIVLLGQNLEGLKAAYAGVADSAGAAARAQRIMEEGMGQQWAILMNGLRELGLELGSALLPTLRELLPSVKSLLSAVADFARAHPEGMAVALGLVGLAAVASPVLAAAGALATLTGAVLNLTANPAAVVALSTVAALLAKIAAVAAAGYAGWKFGEVIAEQLDKIASSTVGYETTLGGALYDLVQQWEGASVEIPRIAGFIAVSIVNAFGGQYTTFSAMIEQWKAAGANLIQGLRDGIASGLRGALGIGQKLDDAIAYLRAKVKDWYSVGEDIIHGLWEGIKANIRKPLEAIADLARRLPQWAKDLLGIKSPSRVFVEIGENIGAGLALGIDASLPRVQDAAERLTEVVQVSPSGQPRFADGRFKSMFDAAQHGSGMLGGLREYVDGVREAMDAAKDITVRAFKGMEDALVSFVKTGKLDFKSLADSIIADLIRIQIQRSITLPLARAMGSIDFGRLFGFAQGGAPGGVSAWRNQIVDRPTFFTFANGGVMGEAGPEAIMPLRRVNGRLGVDASGVGNVQVIINNNVPGAQAIARQRDEGGVRIVEVVVEQIKASIAGDIGRGTGAIPDALASTYGLNRVAGVY